mmetsp:Transcript_86057/g.216904  ORF Transcript_86057/g.216904 Transcript_86057/m.216904 type:complete len:117 (+) Transcript_86057:95-445(+)
MSGYDDDDKSFPGERRRLDFHGEGRSETSYTKSLEGRRVLEGDDEEAFVDDDFAEGEGEGNADGLLGEEGAVGKKDATGSTGDGRQNDMDKPGKDDEADKDKPAKEGEAARGEGEK